MNPDNVAIFRCARLLLLLDLIQAEPMDGIDAERLGLYDFLAAHPLLLARDSDDPDRLTLQLAGFDDRSLAYRSVGQRLVSAQLRLSGDLSLLVAAGMVGMTVAGRIRYRLTEHGRDTVQTLTAAYGHSYTIAARIIVRRLRRLSGRRLRSTVRGCIAASPNRADG